MNSSVASGRLPKTCKWGSMSYTYGDHMDADEIYFGGDNRVSFRPKGTEGPDPPAWLVADWLLASKRGEPLSSYARSVLKNATPNNALRWFRTYLDQYEET